ncbi:MAG: hypothetical protein QOJ18_798, partial [Microbacteriaceae bacterium]|nr:hypothetical protein [Microbacteriaceae bacterium]
VQRMVDHALEFDAHDFTMAQWLEYPSA